MSIHSGIVTFCRCLQKESGTQTPRQYKTQVIELQARRREKSSLNTALNIYSCVLRSDCRHDWNLTGT